MSTADIVALISAGAAGLVSVIGAIFAGLSLLRGKQHAEEDAARFTEVHARIDQVNGGSK